jgi:hypothetical protein
MAQVTVELGRLLDKTNFKLFDFPYQFDDATYKAQLEQNIIDFYYDYEIGMETPDMFKRKFKARWQRIIPFYNKLYNTTLLMYNPLTNYSIKDALEQLSTSSSTTDSNSSNNIDSTTDSNSSNNVDSTTDTTGNSHTVSDSDSKTSDYPQQPIAGGDYLAGAGTTTTDATTDNTGNTTNNTTGSATDKTTNNTTGTATGKTTATGTNNTEYTKTIEGITGTTYPELIQKHREALMRINDMVIEEMKKCFILVF